MTFSPRRSAAVALSLSFGWLTASSSLAADWLMWRGPLQNGQALERYASNEFKPEPLWQLDLAGQGAPLVLKDKLYYLGYRGEKAALKEIFACVDGLTGKIVWEHEFRDFLSDNIYDRYAIGTPGYDPKTGNFFVLTTPGELISFSPEGKVLWKQSLMEEVGRLTFPNGRTGSPVVDGDLVYVNCISSNWGAAGAGANRIYAFDTKTGAFVWGSQPGLRPMDASFSTPFFETRWGQRVFYVGTGDGNVCCLNARTGEPLWRFPLSKVGINASPTVVGDVLLAIHNDENIDSADSGRLVGISIPKEIPPKPEPPATGAAMLPTTAEAWRMGIGAWSSSPVVVDGVLYQMTSTGNLYAIKAENGEVVWHLKLSESNLHSSPVYANGLLYAPFKGSATGPGGGYEAPLFVIDAKTGEVITSIKLEGECNGSPAVSNGRLYVATRKKLFALQIAGGQVTDEPAPSPVLPTPGAAAALQIVPGEVFLLPGEQAVFTVYEIDKHGERLGEAKNVKWEKYIPPTARVKSEADADFQSGNVLAAGSQAKLSAGAFRAVTPEGHSGTIRARVLTPLPLRQDFEGFELTEDHEADGVKFAYPPLPWLGARFKWEVRDLDGSKVLTKTLDQMFFQRAMTFIGPSSMKDYTVQADVLTDGTRRMKSEVGLINQRYLVALKGNAGQLEISSNYERLLASVPFPVKAKQWYRLKTRVDMADDGTATVRAKAWERGQPEPEAWTIETTQKDGHRFGSPGVFGFSPQSQMRVYLDNIEVTPNEAAAQTNP